MNTANTLFPRHDIDPKRKTSEWGLQAGKAIWSEHEGTASKIFLKNKSRYDEIMKYVIGKQPTDKYKLLLLGPEACKDEDSLLAIDWEPRPVMPKLLSIAVSKVLNRGYNYTCHPIDSLAKDEAEKYFNQIKIKMLQREAALQAAPELAQNPAFIREYGEPEDMEELEIDMEYGAKSKRAMDTEMAIRLVMYQNDYEEIRKRNVQSLVYFGAASSKDYIDENSDIRIRDINIRNSIVSNSKKDDFSDKTYWAEVIELPLSQLAAKFNKEELAVIQEQALNKDKYPRELTEFNEEFDPFKVNVLDFEILSWNTQIYQQRVDSRGNLVVRKEKYSEAAKNSKKMVKYKDAEIPQYANKTKEVIYKGKWVVGTDFIYDYGIAADTKSTKRNRASLELSGHFQAVDFHDMEAAGLAERLISIVDEYQMTIYKVQQFKNKWIPYVIDVDFDSLEAVAIGKGGKKFTPKQILEMVYTNFTLVSRKSDLARQNVNHKSIDVRPTGMAQEYQVLAGDLARLLGEMRDVLGLNEVTDGSSPNPNMLNYVASLGAEATNNALRHIMAAEKKLGENLARGIMLRLMKVVQRKKIEGLVPALGSESMKFFSVSPDIALHEWGLVVEDQPTQQERQALLQDLDQKEGAGMITAEDKVMVYETTNIRQARRLLALRIKKREKQAKEYELQKMKMNGEVQRESGIAVEKAKQETIALEYKLKREVDMDLKLLDKEIKILELQSKERIADTNSEGKVATQALANEAKVDRSGGKSSEKK